MPGFAGGRRQRPNLSEGIRRRRQRNLEKDFARDEEAFEAGQRKKRRQRALQRERGREAGAEASAVARRRAFAQKEKGKDKKERRKAFTEAPQGGGGALISKTKKQLMDRAKKIKTGGKGCNEPISQYSKGQLIQFIQTHG